MFEMYLNFANAVKDKLIEEVNGKVVYKIYASIDTVIFEIHFKDFKFDFGVNNVQENLYTNNAFSSEVVEMILKKYRVAVLKAFFKTEERKERDSKKKLGIFLEEL